jgi:Putative transposase
VIPNISALRLASSAFSTPGTRNLAFTRMSIASLPPVARLPMARAGSSHAILFFFSSRCSVACFAASLSLVSKQAFQDGQLNFHGNLALLAQPKTFAACLRRLFRKDWVVYAKPPFGGPDYVLQYLGRYTHRVAISNHRLISLVDGQVTFRWRDSAHHNEQKLLTLSLDEFLRRFLLHVLPKGFVRIRNFGWLANRRRATLLPLCFHLLGSAPQTEQELKH